MSRPGDLADLSGLGATWKTIRLADSAADRSVMWGPRPSRGRSHM
ncbi:hypothetical protein [Nocardia abscessus]|nr:hypothetical protein [Nocardia abscessus]